MFVAQSAADQFYSMAVDWAIFVVLGVAIVVALYFLSKALG